MESLVSPRFFCLREFFSRALLSERLEQANLNRVMNNVTEKHISIECNEFVGGYRHSEMHLRNYSRLVTFRVGRVASRELHLDHLPKS